MTTEEREAYDKLPPWMNTISDYILYRICDELKLYEPLMDRIQNYLNDKLEIVKTLFSVKALNSRKQRKKSKFKKACNFYK